MTDEEKAHASEQMKAALKQISDEMRAGHEKELEDYSRLVASERAARSRLEEDIRVMKQRAERAEARLLELVLAGDGTVR